ncbi:hypothetical protein REPUB_Repub07fG0242800 [Reevesia pubescens]
MFFVKTTIEEVNYTILLMVKAKLCFEVESLQDLDQSVEIFIRLLCAIPGWNEKNVQVQQQVFEVVTYLASNATRFPKECVVLCLLDIKGFLTDVKPALLSALDAEYEKNPFEKTVEASESTSLSAGQLDSLPREDISRKITPALLKSLESPDWKVRGHAQFPGSYPLSLNRGGIGDKTHHFTLLDGEMIIDTVPNSQKQDRRYPIYEMMAFNCTSVIENHDVSLFSCEKGSVKSVCCRRQQNGGYLDVAAPDGLMRLGPRNISVPSLLAKASMKRVNLLYQLFMYSETLFDSENNNLLPTIAKANFPPCGHNFVVTLPAGLLMEELFQILWAGLNERDGAPFMRVRVVGLTTWNYHGKGRPKEGIITIWNPIEKQIQKPFIYKPENLSPTGSLYLPLAMECFLPFFGPQKSIKLSNLGEISLSSEFGIVAYVVYVGEVYTAAHQKKQWSLMMKAKLMVSHLKVKLPGVRKLFVTLPTCRTR